MRVIWNSTRDFFGIPADHEGYTTIALFGLDDRSNGNLSKGNSDVIMIASINNDTHEVKLVSVYRDSYLDIGNSTYRKCNAPMRTADRSRRSPC